MRLAVAPLVTPPSRASIRCCSCGCSTSHPMRVVVLIPPSSTTSIARWGGGHGTFPYLRLLLLMDVSVVDVPPLLSFNMRAFFPHPESTTNLRIPPPRPSGPSSSSSAPDPSQLTRTPSLSSPPVSSKTMVANCAGMPQMSLQTFACCSWQPWGGHTGSTTSCLSPIYDLANFLHCLAPSCAVLPSWPSCASCPSCAVLRRLATLLANAGPNFGGAQNPRPLFGSVENNHPKLGGEGPLSPLKILFLVVVPHHGPGPPVPSSRGSHTQRKISLEKERKRNDY
jgi:hypothetical protein